MAYTTIDDPSVYFQTVLYTGNQTARSITNDGNSDLQPDWVWDKNRTTSGYHHNLYDSSRGTGKQLRSNTTDAEITQAQGVTAFNSDGFSLGTDDSSNKTSSEYVAWQWKANGGTTSSNNDGSYTSTVQANTTAGFSIVKYGDASSFSASTPATVGHGLGNTPKWIVIKNLDGTRSWGVHHVSNGAGKIIYLDLTNAVANSTGFDNGTLPTSSVFTVNTLNVANGNNLEYIAYCFAEIQGFSKFGSYTGNGDADGPFVYTGFKPAWVMIKVSSGNTGGWDIYDSKRLTFNPNEEVLQANASSAEASDDAIDLLSNGFKIRNTTGNQNGSGNTHIYMAFAEHPFVSSKGVPVTAK
jgi:hypothetical protein